MQYAVQKKKVIRKSEYQVAEYQGTRISGNTLEISGNLIPDTHYLIA